MAKQKPDFKSTTHEMYSVAAEMFTKPAKKSTAANMNVTEELTVKKIRKKDADSLTGDKPSKQDTRKLAVKKIRKKDTYNLTGNKASKKNAGKLTAHYGQSWHDGNWERRTERLELKLPPSTLNFIKSLASKQGTTVNETVNQIFSELKQAKMQENGTEKRYR